MATTWDVGRRGGDWGASYCSVCLTYDVPVMATLWVRPGSPKALVKGNASSSHTACSPQVWKGLNGSGQTGREQAGEQGRWKGQGEGEDGRGDLADLSRRSFLEQCCSVIGPMPYLHQHHLRGIIKTQIAGPTPFLILQVWGGGWWRLCTCNRFSGEADVAGLGTPSWEPPAWSMWL